MLRKMNSGKQRSFRHLYRIACLAAFVVIISGFAVVVAQQPRTEQLTAPPPMKCISREERAQLDEAKDPKSRTRAAIDLAEEHLSSAERLTSEKKYRDAAEELGHYLAFIGDTLDFLSHLDPGKKQIRDLYRHLDIALRTQIPHLALMRRSTPSEYAANIKDAEEYARNARSEALEFLVEEPLAIDVGANDPARSPDTPGGRSHPR